MVVTLAVKAAPITFDEREWITLASGEGLLRKDLKPCECGSCKFEYRVSRVLFVDSETWTEAGVVKCAKCMKLAEPKRDKNGKVVRTAEIVRAIISMADGSIQPVSDLDTMPDPPSHRFHN